MTNFSKYINDLKDCYYSNYENISLIEKMLESFELFKKSGLEKKDFLEFYTYNNGMFVFQNPTIPEIINEIKKDSKYIEYLTNSKLKGYLIGNIMKKYPSCNIDMVSRMI